LKFSYAELVNAITCGKYDTVVGKWTAISEEAKDLVGKLMEVDVDKRLSTREALQHVWLVN